MKKKDAPRDAVVVRVNPRITKAIVDETTADTDRVLRMNHDPVFRYITELQNLSDGQRRKILGAFCDCGNLAETCQFHVMGQ